MEGRFGPLGKGRQELLINEAEYDLETMAARLGLNFEDARLIDAVCVKQDHYVIRYYDGQDQRIVAHEFNNDFVFLQETRAHVAEWIGEEAYYASFRGVEFRCPLVPGDNF